MEHFPTKRMLVRRGKCDRRIKGDGSESMRWEDLEQSSNIEDRRGEGGGGGGGFGMPVGGGGLGLGTIVVLGLVGWALGINPMVLIGGAEMLNGGGSSYQQPNRPSPGQQ